MDAVNSLHQCGGGLLSLLDHFRSRKSNNGVGTWMGRVIPELLLEYRNDLSENEVHLLVNFFLDG